MIAGGITHDSRAFSPFPIYVDRADRARKWDADIEHTLEAFEPAVARMQREAAV